MGVKPTWRPRRAARLSVAVIVALGLVAGCGDDDEDTTAQADTAANAETAENEDTPVDPAWQTVLDAAADEGRVVVYSGAVPEVNAKIEEAFEEDFPDIEMELERVSSDVLRTNLETERDTGADGADAVIAASVPTFVAFAEAGDLVAPDSPAAVEWPQDFMLDPTLPIVAYEPLTIVYNTNLVEEPIGGYEDLLREDLRGRLGTADLSGDTLIAFYDFLERSFGDDYLEDLAAQEPRLYTGAVPNTQAVASGEVAATTFSNTSAAIPLIDQGAPIENVVPNPSLGIQYAGVVLGWAHRPDAARVFQDWLMSEGGQSAWMSDGSAASPIGAEGSLDVADIEPYDPFAIDDAFRTSFTDRWTTLFTG